MTNVTKIELNQAKEELKVAGWELVATMMSDTKGLRYGSHFLKDGKEFFLNKDTYMKGFTGDRMAELCVPVFNR